MFKNLELTRDQLNLVAEDITNDQERITNQVTVQDITQAAVEALTFLPSKA